MLYQYAKADSNKMIISGIEVNGKSKKKLYNLDNRVSATYYTTTSGGYVVGKGVRTYDVFGNSKVYYVVNDGWGKNGVEIAKKYIDCNVYRYNKQGEYKCLKK